MLATLENIDKTFQRNRETQFWREIDNIFTDTPENTERQNFPTKQTYTTLLGNRQNFPSRTKTRWVGDISLMPWTGEYWGPAEPPPQPRQASHRTEPDYDSLEDHCRCLLKFSAWPFTLIVHKMNKLGHLKAHAS